MNGKSKLSVLLLLSFIAGAFIFALREPAVAADYSLEVGGELELELELSSRHEDWVVETYDDSIIELEKREKAVAPRRVVFLFSGRSEGSTEVSFVRRIATRLVEREIDSRTYTFDVTAVEPDPEPDEEPDEEPEPPEEREAEYYISLEYSQYDLNDLALAVSDTVHREWSSARDLRERGQYEAARDLIEENIENFSPDDENDDSLQVFWREKLALNYMADENFGNAIEIWENLVDNHPGQDVARRLYMIARAQRADGAEDEADITLRLIRHRHRQRPEWVPAMLELGDLMEEQGDYEEARSLWEQAQQAAAPQYQADLFLRLAELYRGYREVRDFPRAVEYYRRAADLLVEEEPEKAEEINERAQHLVENYINYGVE